MHARHFLVEDAKAPGTYLGQMGWVRKTTQALLFIGDDSARSWLDSIKLVTKALLVNREPKIIPAPDGMVETAPPNIQTDFDPFRPEAR